MTAKGNLFVIAAPSGAGKTSLVKAVVEQTPGVVISVSHTTRAARPGEQDGVNYHFVCEQDFNELVKQGDFLEHANVFGHHYGTSRAWIEQRLVAGDDVILEIDWQGAQQVREKFPKSESIFILPPSEQSLRTRLEQRHQDSAEVIEHRMSLAKQEVSHYAEFDYLVVNDEFDVALEQIKTIIKGRRLRRGYQQQRLADLLAEWQ